MFLCKDYEYSFMCSVKNEVEVDEKLSHMRPVVVLETLNLSQYVYCCISEMFGLHLTKLQCKFNFFYEIIKLSATQMTVEMPMLHKHRLHTVFGYVTVLLYQ